MGRGLIAERFASTMLASAEDAVPKSSQRRECEVAGFVTFMVPVMVMWHLRIGEPILSLVGEVQVTADARMLFKALEDAEDV